MVIPTLGRPLLKRCLRSIVAGSHWPSRVIVVEQGDGEEVPGWLREIRDAGLRTEHLLSTERGRARGVNRGLERVTTRFVAITDDDCTVDAGWLRQTVLALREDPGAVVTGRVEAGGESQVLPLVTSLEPAVWRRPRLVFDTLSGGNMAVAMQVVARVGALDEDPRLRCAEDNEWAYRALRSAVPIRFVPAAVVWHHDWREPEQTAAQLRAYARSHGAFYGKYLRRLDLFIALRAMLHFLRALRRWIRGVVNRRPDVAAFGRAYVTGLLPGILSGLRRPVAGAGAETRRRSG